MVLSDTFDIGHLKISNELLFTVLTLYSMRCLDICAHLSTWHQVRGLVVLRVSLNITQKLFQSNILQFEHGACRLLILWSSSSPWWCRCSDAALCFCVGGLMSWTGTVAVLLLSDLVFGVHWCAWCTLHGALYQLRV